MWGQFFFVRRHLTTDQRSLLFNMITPPVLTSSHVTDMYTYFERSFANHQNWLRNQIKLFGEQWLNSECGQAWKQHIADVDASPMGTANLKFESPESPADLLRWKDSNGIQFTKLQAIEFFKKFLQVVETDDDGTGETIGWLEGDSSDFWLEELMNVALKLILAYVCIEGKVQDCKAASANILITWHRPQPWYDKVVGADGEPSKHLLRGRR